MWPPRFPPPHPAHAPMLPPKQLPPFHAPMDLALNQRPPQLGDERALPPWQRRDGEGLNTWRTNDEPSWRRPPAPNRYHHPYSNHELYHQQYSQVPLSRPRPSHWHQSRYTGGPSAQIRIDERVPMHSFVPEYEAQIDFERQLRENYEERSKDEFATGMEGKRKIEMRTEPSAKRIKVSWKLPPLSGNDDKFKLHLAVRVEELEGGLVRGARANELGLIIDRMLPIHVQRTEINTIPGSIYAVKLSVFEVGGNEVVALGLAKERASFSLEEMKVLMQKAVQFTGIQMQPFTFLYRCKPKIYWDFVTSHTSGVMNAYEKDSNGQAAGPMNGNLSGLFFSARFNARGEIPDESPFGNIRFTLPAHLLLDPNSVNLYFADFYCNRTTHYITVVVCREGSSADRFSRQRLIPLKPFDNPFLLLRTTNSQNVPILYSINNKVWVEIYYTDNIPIEWGQLHMIRPLGKGTSKIGGLLHNKACRTCNLYPIGPSSVAHPPPENVEHITEEQAAEMVKEAAKAELVDERRDADEDSFYEENDERKRAETIDRKLVDEWMSQLAQLEEELSTSGIGESLPDGSLLKALLEQVNGLVRTMDDDFAALDAQLDKLEMAIVPSQRSQE